MKIRALIFDFDGTLVFINNWSDYWRGIFEKSIQMMGGEYSEDFEALYHFTLNDYPGKIRVLRQWGVKASVEEFLETVGVVDHKERLNLLRRGETGFYPDVERFLRYNKLNGRRFGIVTYSLKETVDEYFSRFHKDLVYDAIYDRRSALSTKHWKPSPRPIIKLSRQLKSPLDQVIVVGDREMDVESGLRSGSKTVLIQREDSETKNIVLKNLQQRGVNPDLTVCSLDELTRYLTDKI